LPVVCGDDQDVQAVRVVAKKFRKRRRGQNDAINPEQTSEPKGQQFSPVLNVIQLARILAAMW
jgi:hypothetical protein